MSDVQRWKDMWYGEDHGELLPREDGEYVLYDDHVAALRACEQRVLDDDVLAAAYHGQKGYERGLEVARDAVAALCIAEWHTRPADREICGLCRHYIAAIDALAGES